ncbi:hypothetical protein GYB61_09170 [bacterium]|nr:hypothetical protein [bacterium]
MNDRNTGGYRFGDWVFDLQRGALIAGSGSARPESLDSRLVAVLNCLLTHPGQILSHAELLALAWPDRVVTRDSLTTAIHQLRQRLGDSADRPVYIRTEARRGYRWICPVERLRPARQRWMPRLAAGIAAGFLVVAIAGVTVAKSLAPQPITMLPAIVGADNAVEQPLRDGLHAVVLDHLISQFPGRVQVDSEPLTRGLVIETHWAHCDRNGPVLLARIRQSDGQKYLWSAAYPVNLSPQTPSLARRLASDVISALDRLS